MAVFYTLCNTAFRGALGAFADYAVEGKENIPEKGPLIVVANHQSNLDPPILCATLSRRLRFLAKNEVFSGPVVTLLLNWYGAFPVRRGMADRRAFQWILDQLASPHGVIALFPEGTRNPGAMGRARPGVATVAIRTRAVLLPVGIAGSEKLGPVIRVLYPKADIRVRIGEPFVVPAPEQRSKPVLQAVTEEIMGRIARLLPESYRGCYARAAHAPDHFTRTINAGESVWADAGRASETIL